jgi:(R,R)-butanediol dehydrogenase/meso-butanediol dehydrogenase/diacetyl reductase
MRAVRWHGRGDVRLDEIPVPEPAVGQVLLRVEAAAICGTDVDEVRWGPVTVPLEPHPVSGRAAPITLGHEIVGSVAHQGPGSQLPVGTRVAPWPSRPCGHCRDCATGHANRCPSMVSLGMSVDGGMADFVAVDEADCVTVDPGLPMERAVLVEPGAVVLHALHRADVRGRRIAVVGIGSVGLLMIEAARRAGAATVVAVARSERSRAAARAAGADEVQRPDAAARVDAELVFETAGAAPAVAAALAATRRGGRVIVLGGHVRPLPLELLDLTVREVALEGSVSHCFEDFVAAARAIAAGDLAATPREVELAPLEAGPDLLRAEASGVKRILVPGRS